MADITARSELDATGIPQQLLHNKSSHNASKHCIQLNTSYAKVKHFFLSFEHTFIYLSPLTA